jgi:hypothetical protein
MVRATRTGRMIMARALKPLTTETLQEEVRFLLKTLLRDDLFGDEVGVTEAEKLLESSLSVGFVEYCAFLKRHAFIDIDRAKNTIAVLPRGRNYADGSPDPSLGPALGSHFAARLGTAPPSTLPPLSTTPPPPTPAPVAPAFGGAAADVLRPRRPLGVDEKKSAQAAIALLDRERYVRGDVIGQGSLGIVMLARDATLERDVVVKEVRHVYDLVTYVPKDEITARVKQAVMAQARLDHPHILRVVDVQFAHDAPTIVLDRAVESLATRMARGLMPVEVVLRVLLQIAYGLGHAHRHDIVHGGLKPENVLFDGAGNVKLADFGIARVAERSSSEPTSSAPPVYVGRGHPSYMAPEQLHKGRVIPQADVYALGILLYEMLTGNLPGRRSPMPSSSERVVAAVGKDRIEALDDLFDRMTRDPLHERFASIDDVLEHLYRTFPAGLVGQRGTLMLSEVDPLPPGGSAPVSDGIERDDDDVDAPPSTRAEVTLITRPPQPPEA